MMYQSPNYFALVVLYVFSCALEASASELELNDQARAFIDAALSQDCGPGMQVAVIRDGTLVFSYASGYADVEQNVALHTDTRMRIGSLSKLFTYALVARLIRDGRMSPDEDIRKYVPELPDKGSKITPRQIASHTSGIRHYDFQNLAEANNTRYYETLSDALALFADDPLLNKPGAGHHYSSLAVNLLGVAAERAADNRFGAAVEQNVLRPAGLRHSTPDHPLEIIPKRSRFYTIFHGSLVNTFWRDSSDYYPSGGMLSTAEDIANLTKTVFEGNLLGESEQQLLRTEARLTDGRPVGYTFGWQVSRTESGGLMYHHGGETNGAYGNVLYLPDAKLIVAGNTNYNVFPDQSQVAFFGLVREQLPQLFQN